MDIYYSVVVRADESQPMSGDRMFEGTSQEIASHFMNGGSPDLRALSRYPVILTKEFRDDDASTEAVIGYMDHPSMNPHISRPILRFPASALMDRGILSGGWAGSRTRWMVFEGDPYYQLAGVESGTSPVNPVVVDKRKIAVMMPFKHDASIDPVYRAMERGARNAGFECVRVDQLMTPGDITDDIQEIIVGSRAVIADLSGKNLNVMYELGFAHGHGKKVVLVSSDSPKDLPFDIRSQRVLSYQENEAGLYDLSNKVCQALKGIN